MPFINNFFFNLVSKNIRFKDKYKNQSCYIIGNGQSIKFFDLKKFSKKKTLTCSWMYLHNDYKHLDVVADLHFHPGIFAPIWKNPYSKKFELNHKCRNFLRKTGRLNGNIELFTSAYHFPFIFRKKKINYLHHFGIKEFLPTKIDPSKEFSLLYGSLFSLIGLANYMGFSKFYLIGMDYLYINPKNGHFYEFGINNQNANIKNLYLRRVKKLFKFVSKNLNKKIIIIGTQKSKSKLAENISYEKKFKSKLDYKENFQIINKKKLDGLSNITFEYNIYQNNR
tara:strand:- start:403 stop:1245 length:843 start_codon:yes stop_codon:yes gene_type:complete